MANYNKSFNFRNGVQVDNDNFIVNANGLVGIGTSIPTEVLDIYGIAKVTGLVTTTNLAVSGVSTFYSDVKVGSGITFNPSTGSVNATTFYGSAAGLTDIYAIAVDGWVVGGVSISTSFNVGIKTNNPFYALQVGNDPSFGNGFSVDHTTGNVRASGSIIASSFTGSGAGVTSLDASSISSGTLNNSRLPQDINISGIITASSFTGSGAGVTSLNASSISSGTLNNSRLPQDINISGIITANSGFITSITNTNLSNTGIATLGIVTASQLYVSGMITSFEGFSGYLFGSSAAANGLSGTPDITVGFITCSGINNLSGTITSPNISAERVSASISIGVGTEFPLSDIHIRKTSASTLQLTSDSDEAIVVVGKSTSKTISSGAFRFGNTSVTYPYSTSKSLDVINYDTGNVNHYLHYGVAGVGTGNFNWIYAPTPSSPLMTLTYRGNLGVGTTNPSNTLTVVGSGTSTTQLYASGVSTSINGFTSGIGTAVKITTVGNKLIFTVVGVGSTSLTLY